MTTTLTRIVHLVVRLTVITTTIDIMDMEKGKHVPCKPERERERGRSRDHSPGRSRKKHKHKYRSRRDLNPITYSGDSPLETFITQFDNLVIFNGYSASEKASA